MPKTINTAAIKRNTPPQPTYNASHLEDAYGIAESDLSWSVTALGDLNYKFRQLKTNIQTAHNVSDAYFDDMQEFLHMYEYLIESRHSYHQAQAKQYQQEWEAAKGEAV